MVQRQANLKNKIKQAQYKQSKEKSQSIRQKQSINIKIRVNILKQET